KHSRFIAEDVPDALVRRYLLLGSGDPKEIVETRVEVDLDAPEAVDIGDAAKNVSGGADDIDLPPGPQEDDAVVGVGDLQPLVHVGFGVRLVRFLGTWLAEEGRGHPREPDPHPSDHLAGLLVFDLDRSRIEF